MATVDLQGGGVGSLTTVWHDIGERPSLRYLEVHCERAWFAVEEDWWGPLRWTRAGETRELEGEALLAACAERGIGAPNPDGEFLRAVIEGGQAAPSASVALRAHRIVDAIYRSADAGGAPIVIDGD